MWARVLNRQLVEIIYQPKAMVINDIQHPKTIFTRAWTNEERKAIGILPYTYSGSNINNEYYTSTFSDSVGDDAVTRTYTNNAVSDISRLKANKIDEAKQNANSLLSDTDWYVVRNVETSTAIPSEITAFRTAVRTNYAALKTAITNAAIIPITLNSTDGSSNAGDNIVQEAGSDENDRMLYEDATLDDSVAAVAALYSFTASANSNESITIDGTSSSVVSTSANSITSNAHGFVVGEILIYDNGGGADIGGLVHETQYYVYSKTVNTFKLSHSHSNCGDAAIISLSSVASSGTSHTFKSSGVPGAGNTWPNSYASIYTV
tara:strand:- start:249 stop:1208 length:960 start_codon:yes stop_codon:yes gene_type:complete